MGKGGKLSRKAPVFVCFLLVSLFAGALDWPVREGDLTQNFGVNDNGMPFQGNSFRSPGPIYPSDLGELVFFNDSSVSASRFPSPLGSWAALDHGDNILGIYGRFEDKQGEPISAILERETVLANSGVSGWAGEEGFFFAFLDRKERRWINPSIIISPFEDDRPPVIRQVELRGVSGPPVNPALARTVSQGTYTVYVDAYDTVSGSGQALAPNRIICTVNGAETEELKFEFMAAKNGVRSVYRNGPTPVKQVYHSPPGYEAGRIRLSRGQVTLTVEVSDIAGNSLSRTYRLNVE